MARTRKAATVRKPVRKVKRKSTTRPSAKRAAAKRRPARKVARKAVRKTRRKAARPRSLGGRIVKAVESVLDTLSEAERLHTRTTRKAGFQELE